MKTPKVSFGRTVIAGLVALGTLSFGGAPSILSGNFVTKASARIGRPLTPLSYAGVARRTTRRTVAYGAAAGAAVAYGAGTRCVQVVDAYGRISTRCY